MAKIDGKLGEKARVAAYSALEVQLKGLVDAHLRIGDETRDRTDRASAVT